VIREKIVQWLLRPAGGKSNLVTTLMALSTPGSAMWSQFSYQRYASEAYAGNPYVHRGIKLVGDAVAALEIYARQVTDGTPVSDTHPMARVLAKPNGYQSWHDFMRELVGHMYIAGEVFVVLPESRSELLTFNILRPDQVEDKRGSGRMEVTEYVYGLGRDRQSFPPERIVHIRTFNPLDEWRGLSPLSPAAKSIDLNNAARSFHKALLDNGAVPGLVITSTKSSQQKDIESLRSQLRARQGAGYAGTSMVLGATEKLERAAWSPTEAAWPDGMTMTLREIALAVGVAPELLGDSSSKTYSNYQEARQGLYIETVLPLADLLLSAISEKLQEWYSGIEYAVDRDTIDALQESQDGLWDRVLRGFEAGVLTMDDALEAIGYEPTGESWAQEHLAVRGQTLQPVAEMPLLAPTAQPEPEPEKLSTELALLLRIKQELEVATKAAGGRERAERDGLPIMERIVRKLIDHYRRQALAQVREAS